MKKFILLSVTLLILSCNSDDDNSSSVYCTDVFVYGLSITVKNAVTDDVITEGLIITAKDGSYEEQLMRIEDSDYFLGAGKRDGTYVVEITSNDYQNFISNNIIVSKTEDDCHVITNTIEFLIQPN